MSKIASTRSCPSVRMPFQREFAAFDKTLHLQEAILIFVQPRDIGIGKKFFDALKSNGEFGGIVSANDTPAGG